MYSKFLEAPDRGERTGGDPSPNPGGGESAGSLAWLFQLRAGPCMHVFLAVPWRGPHGSGTLLS